MTTTAAVPPRFFCPGFGLLLSALMAAAVDGAPRDLEVDRSRVHASAAIAVHAEGSRVRVQWPLDEAGAQGELLLRIGTAEPLIEALAIAKEGGRRELLRDVDPVFFLTVGSRQGLRSDGWVVFFDRVHQRPYTTHQATLTPQRIQLQSHGERASVVIDGLEAGPFSGHLEFAFFAGGPLVRIDAVMSTNVPKRALLYDAGLVGDPRVWDTIGWKDTRGRWRPSAAARLDGPPPRAVKHRTVVATRAGRGSVAVFPPPHQFFYPLDFSNNFGFNWAGEGLHGERRFGIGIRLPPRGDRRFVPWFNAPPGTRQRMSQFLLLGDGDGPETMERVLRYTHGDRFPRLAGYRTFTSHYHVAHTMDVLEREARGEAVDDIPEFVSVFRDMGVEIVHLAEFHGDGHPRDRGSRRLKQLERMHRECARLSGNGFLLLPGEEPNVHFGGHWISFFPRPVYWIMSRVDGEPFVREHPRYGRVYRVGNAAEMHRLLRQEEGLAWTAHARIKSSHGFPDRHRSEVFFLSDRYLGAAWKAMPADLSRPRLGERVLDLLDDMSNWAVTSSPPQSVKYALGEVDVFKIDRTHELYGHMNINYVELDEVPRFEDGWQPLLHALRRGRFFVTTGEVTITGFQVGGSSSGETVRRPARQPLEVTAELTGTFPLAFAEVISGDGQRVYRERIDLSGTREFSTRNLRHSADLTQRRWVRLEVWDIAANGAFTQPVWIE